MVEEDGKNKLSDSLSHFPANGPIELALEFSISSANSNINSPTQSSIQAPIQAVLMNWRFNWSLSWRIQVTIQASIQEVVVGWVQQSGLTGSSGRKKVQLNDWRSPKYNQFNLFTSSHELFVRRRVLQSYSISNRNALSTL